ncbi:MAG TPA: ABC transporter ATP-binding protein [Actinomycetota bacterium]|nr:ABC transporter ATP-binding protein [Actinomycetota bacterium]
MSAVDISDLVVSYSGRRVVDELDLRIPQGTTCVLLGPNGAGKTTTLNVILGLRRPDQGEVNILGLAPHDPALRSRIGVVLQEGGLPVSASPAAIVNHFASLYANPLPPAEVMDRLGLHHLDRQYRRLSGGEQQRVKLAVALLSRPRLLLLDEPTTGMDPAARRVFWTLLDEIRAQGVTTLLTTHQPDEVSSRADQVVVIHHGTVIANGPPAQLIERAPTWFTCARHLDLSSLRDVLGAAFDIVEVEPGRYRVTGDVGVAQIAAINAWVAAHGDGAQEVSVVRTLEEAYLDMTGGVAW